MSNETIAQFIEMLLSAAIAIAVPVITAALVRWISSKRQEIEDQVPGEILYTIRTVADLVVTAAEQSGLWDEALATGKAKKEWAMQMGEQWLRETFGLSPSLAKLSDEVWTAILQGLDMAIERRVRGMKGGEVLAE